MGTVVVFTAVAARLGSPFRTGATQTCNRGSFWAPYAGIPPPMCRDQDLVPSTVGGFGRSYMRIVEK
jgi:hypothetical protein